MFLIVSKSFKWWDCNRYEYRGFRLVNKIISQISYIEIGMLGQVKNSLKSKKSVSNSL